MNSLDFDHVDPNPNPANLWRFEQGKRQTIAAQPFVTMQLIELQPERALFEMVYGETGERVLTDYLNLDRPCVALRFPTGAPLLTFIFRGVEGNMALLQVSIAPGLPQVSRQ